MIVAIHSDSAIRSWSSPEVCFTVQCEILGRVYVCCQYQ